MKTQRLQLRLDENILARIRALAELRGLSVSALLRVLVLEAHRATFGEVAASPLTMTERVPSTPVLAPARSNAEPRANVSLADLHRDLFGTEPTDNQVKFYSFRPVFHGVPSREIDDETADAVLCSAVAEAMAAPEGTVKVLAPSDHAKHMMERIRVLRAGLRAAGACERWERHLRQIHAGLYPSWPPMLPENWLAYGLTKEDVVPAWLRRRLAT